MPTLLPLPYYYRLPSGTVTQLPVTRDGVRTLDPQTFVLQPGPALPEITIDLPTVARTVRGLCGLLPADCFSDGSIRPHENTLTSRLERQEKLVLQDGAALGKPVLLTAPSLKHLWERMPATSTPKLRYSNGEGHTYTLCTGGPAPMKIELDAYAPLVIADGHHRAYTHAALAARGLSEFANIPVVIIGADELTIGAFMRVIEVELTSADLLERLEKYFVVTPVVQPYPPKAQGEWLLSHWGEHYHLRRADSTLMPDPGWLIENVLPSVFGITDVRSDPRIQSVEPPQTRDGALVLPPEVNHTVVMLGYPVSHRQFFAEVTAGRVFPPKSTRFTPRIPSGLLVWMP